MQTVKTIKIDPVTRLEGHGKIEIRLDDAGKVADAFFSVAEFRGFEKFCEGRMIWDMPTITNRICGFCPVSHHLASVKACEALLGVEPPPAAVKLRELLHMGQVIHSHSLHFFFCALPDTLYAKENQDLSARSVFGLMNANPNIATNAIKLRKAGQEIVYKVGGARLHPVSCLPGGMARSLEYIDRINLYKGVGAAIKIAQMGVKLVKDLYARDHDNFHGFAAFPSMYMGMVKDDGLELYDGPIRVVDETGKRVKDFEGKDYLDHIEERVEPQTWTKFTYLKERGHPDGAFRVAPLARLNIAQSVSTPLADAEFRIFKKINDGKPVEGGMFYHYARMIELLYAAERAKELLNDPEILSHETRIPVSRRAGEGVGVLEAPRGTLFHHYQADENGRITKVNLIVSTENNNTAMNKSVRDVAEQVVKNGEIPEADLNKLEMAIRCYDPCLSCSTHAHGRMPLVIRIRDCEGNVLSRYARGNLT